MILKIKDYNNLNTSYYISIPERWAAIENEDFYDLFYDIVNIIYDERNPKITEWLGSDSWYIINEYENLAEVYKEEPFFQNIDAIFE